MNENKINMELIQNNSNLDQERLAKLEKLIINGYAWNNKFKRDAIADELHLAYDQCKNEDLVEKNITASVAGRIILRRIMGKASFVILQDLSGKTQIYLQGTVLGMSCG